MGWADMSRGVHHFAFVNFGRNLLITVRARFVWWLVLLALSVVAQSPRSQQFVEEDATATLIIIVALYMTTLTIICLRLIYTRYVNVVPSDRVEMGTTMVVQARDGHVEHVFTTSVFKTAPSTLGASFSLRYESSSLSPSVLSVFMRRPIFHMCVCKNVGMGMGVGDVLRL
jgi:hypothetical protein